MFMEPRSWKQRLESDNVLSGATWSPFQPADLCLDWHPAQGSPHQLCQCPLLPCSPPVPQSGTALTVSPSVAPLTAAFLGLLLSSAHVSHACLPASLAFQGLDIFRDTLRWPFLHARDCRLHAPFPGTLSLRALEINTEEHRRAEIAPIILKAPVVWMCILGAMEGFLSHLLSSIFLSFIPYCFHPIPYGICQILCSYPQNS